MKNIKDQIIQNVLKDKSTEAISIALKQLVAIKLATRSTNKLTLIPSHTNLL